MSYQQFNKYSSYKTVFIPSEKRTNKPLADLKTDRFVFTVDHFRKEQRVYEVFSIDRYANTVKTENRKNSSVDPDFTLTEMYDSNGKTWTL